eukprot:COSAG03_NODE_8009_length_846_cov_0.560910_3_plen_49_part_01
MQRWAARIAARRSSALPERDENGMLVLNNDLQGAEHKVHLRKGIQRLRH